MRCYKSRFLVRLLCAPNAKTVRLNITGCIKHEELFRQHFFEANVILRSFFSPRGAANYKCWYDFSVSSLQGTFLKQLVRVDREEDRRPFLPLPAWQQLFQHNSNGGGNSGILPKTKLSAKKACVSSPLVEEAGLCGDTFDEVEVVGVDFCRKERILSRLS